MNSPFNNLIDMFREEGKFYNEPSFYFAKVTSELPNLKVMLNDMELNKNNLLIDKSLLDRHNYSITCSEGNINHNLKDKLSIGDKVVMLRDGNKFIIMSKVVRI
jgi:hypothetical protein